MPLQKQVIVSWARNQLVLSGMHTRSARCCNWRLKLREMWARRSAIFCTPFHSFSRPRLSEITMNKDVGEERPMQLCVWVLFPPLYNFIKSNWGGGVRERHWSAKIKLAWYVCLSCTQGRRCKYIYIPEDAGCGLCPCSFYSLQAAAEWSLQSSPFSAAEAFIPLSARSLFICNGPRSAAESKGRTPSRLVFLSSGK